MRKVNANRLLWLTVVGLTVVLITSVIGVSDQRAVNAARRVEPTDARSNSSGEPPGTFGSPSILWTKPADGEWNVSLGQPIIIRFNESMTFLVMFDLVPDASPYFVTWTEADTNFSINHRLFSICTLYTASVRWDDGFGNWLSYSWRFLTVCLPFIRHTLPFNGSVDVGLEQEIRVEFNEPMENTSLVFTIDPPAGILSYAWLSGDTTVIINHSALFADATLYTAEVVSATNRSGGALQPGLVPNPWTFSTRYVPLYVARTDPPDGAVDVPLRQPIEIEFSKPVDATSMMVSINPIVTLVPAWINSRTVMLAHTQPFAPCARYSVFVQARDLNGISIVPGPVPNPFSFTTVCTQPPRGLQVHRSPPDDVFLAWTALHNATYYLVFHSNDRFSPWPWMEIARVTTDSATIQGHLSDGLDHFYIVRAYGSAGENSTMGALWHPHFSPVGGSNSAFWFSLPYKTEYRKASDIANELGCSNINLVGKVDSTSQKLIFYYCLQDEWRGYDFPIFRGEALLMGVAGNLDWAVNGTDTTFSMTLILNPAADTHFNWVGLPHTGSISTASGLVISIYGGLGPGTDTKIDAIGKWNYTKQNYDVFRYTPNGWSGIDFTLGTGDCIWMEIKATFAWTPELVTPEVP